MRHNRLMEASRDWKALNDRSQSEVIDEISFGSEAELQTAMLNQLEQIVKGSEYAIKDSHNQPADGYKGMPDIVVHVNPLKVDSSLNRAIESLDEDPTGSHRQRMRTRSSSVSRDNQRKVQYAPNSSSNSQSRSQSTSKKSSGSSKSYKPSKSHN